MLLLMMLIDSYVINKTIKLAASYVFKIAKIQGEIWTKPRQEYQLLSH